MLITRERVFAEHYQFYIFDSLYKHYADSRLEWRDENRLDHGYLATDKAIYVSTISDLNDHRVRIYTDVEPQVQSDDKVFKHSLRLESGKLTISAISNLPDEDIIVDVGVGDYEVTLVCRNAGVDLYSIEPDGDYLEDEVYLERDEFEHYDIFLERTIRAIQPPTKRCS